MGASPSYINRALASDYKLIKQANNILGNQDFDGHKPKPVPDINSDGFLFFACHGQLKNRVTEELIMNDWKCKETHTDTGDIYEYTHARSTDYSTLLAVIAATVDFIWIVLFIAVTLSFHVAFKMQEAMWFEPGSVVSFFSR